MTRIVLVTGCSTGGIGYSLCVFFFPKKNVDKPRTYPYDLFQGVKNLHVKGAKSMPVQGRLKPLPILRTRLLKRFVLMLQVMKVFKML